MISHVDEADVEEYDAVEEDWSVVDGVVVLGMDDELLSGRLPVVDLEDDDKLLAMELLLIREVDVELLSGRLLVVDDEDVVDEEEMSCCRWSYY